MKTLRFYFDFLSPYAWLSWRPLLSIHHRYPTVNFEPIPILFAGLLNHHGQLGPAEIPSKKLYILKDCARRAKLQKLSINPPPTHPFNPLLSLRIASLAYPSAEMKHELIGQLFDAAWKDGKDISDPKIVKEILRNLKLDEEEYFQSAHSAANKEKLRHETESAIASGVFGVPSVLVDNELFWGSESETIQMVEYALQDHPLAGVDPTVLERWAKIKKSADRRHRQE
jgi:2-hydroxychromene-2-carboxylate isomerase